MTSRSDSEDRDIKRSLLIWVGASIEQLHGWESLLAEDFVAGWNAPEAPRNGRLIWRLHTHRHFLMVALAHVLTALKKAREKSVYHLNIDPTIRDEIKETRDLLEHWKENVPIFNTRPRPRQPKHPSGQRWANRNPEPARPYSAFNWNNKDGPRLTPNITSAEVWQILDRIVEDFRATDGHWDDYLPEPQPLAWVEYDTERGKEWWPDSRFTNTDS